VADRRVVPGFDGQQAHGAAGAFTAVAVEGAGEAVGILAGGDPEDQAVAAGGHGNGAGAENPSEFRYPASVDAVQHEKSPFAVA
jgi:hypothetical protein